MRDVVCQITNPNNPKHVKQFDKLLADTYDPARAPPLKYVVSYILNILLLMRILYRAIRIHFQTTHMTHEQLEQVTFSDVFKTCDIPIKSKAGKYVY